MKILYSKIYFTEFIFKKYFLEYKIYILKNIFQKFFSESIFQNINLLFKKCFFENFSKSIFRKLIKSVLVILNLCLGGDQK